MITDLEAPMQYRATAAEDANDDDLYDDSDLEAPVTLAENKEASNMLVKVYDFFHKEGSVVFVDKTQLSETIIDLTESKTFEASKTITCRRCGERGHMAKDCTTPRLCHLCDAEDHSAQECTNRFAKKTCRNCGEVGHIASQCPAPKVPTCSYCTLRGHRKADCPRLKIICKYCRVEGHTINYCSSVPETERPCFRCGKPGHTAKECQQQSTEETWGEGGNAKDNSQRTGWNNGEGAKDKSKESKDAQGASWESGNGSRVAQIGNEDAGGW